MNSREAIAYLKGLLEGTPPTDEGEKRLFDAIFCAIDSLSLELQELKQRLDEGEKVYSDVLDSCLRLEDEMSDLHDEVDLLKGGEEAEGVEEDYEEFYASLTCPACGHSFYYQPDEYEEGNSYSAPVVGDFLTFLDLERREGVDQVEEERRQEEEMASEGVSEGREAEELKEEEEMVSEEATEARPLVPVEEPRGEVKIDESVIGQIAMQALRAIKGVQPSAGSMMSKMGFGRKMYGGVRVSLEDEENPQVTVDTYISVRYGLRIPDVAWDLQETIKNQLEQYTGYTVKAVNVYVQGIHFEDGRPLEEVPKEPAKENESAEQHDAEAFKEEG